VGERVLAQGSGEVEVVAEGLTELLISEAD